MKLRLGNRVDAAAALLIAFGFAAAMLLAFESSWNAHFDERPVEFGIRVLRAVIALAFGTLPFVLGAFLPRDRLPSSPFTRVVASAFLQVKTARVLVSVFVGIGLVTGVIAAWFRYELLAILTVLWCGVFFVWGLVGVETAVFSRLRREVAVSILLGSLLGVVALAGAIPLLHENEDRARLFAFVLQVVVGGIAGLGLSRRYDAETSKAEGASGPRKSILIGFVAVAAGLLFVDLHLAEGYRPLERLGIGAYALLLFLALCRGSVRLVACIGGLIALPAFAGIFFALDRLGKVQPDFRIGALVILIVVIGVSLTAGEIAQIRDAFRISRGRTLVNGLLGGVPLLLIALESRFDLVHRYLDSAIAVFDGRFDFGHGFAIHGLPLGLAIGFVFRERGSVVVLAMACAATGLAAPENVGSVIVLIAVLNSLASCLAFPSDTSRFGEIRNALGGLALLLTSLLPIVVAVGGIAYSLVSKFR